MQTLIFICKNGTVHRGPPLGVPQEVRQRKMSLTAVRQVIIAGGSIPTAAAAVIAFVRRVHNCFSSPRMVERSVIRSFKIKLDSDLDLRYYFLRFSSFHCFVDRSFLSIFVLRN